MMEGFVWPSDRARAENHELNRVCEYLEEVLDELEADRSRGSEAASDIDEIALNTVKAIGEIDPDKLPGGHTQAVAQAQILVRNAINREIEALKAANRDFQGWLNAMKATAWLLRKQADAVDEVNRKLTEISEGMDGRGMDPVLVMQYAASTAGEEAKRLRQQATEAERAGGGNA